MVTSNCGHCKQFEVKDDLPGMQPIICTEPMELVHIDYVGMEVTVATKEKPVVKNVLMVVDHFTRYVQAFVTHNQTAYTTTKKLYNEYFSVFGFPQQLMSDQGTGFTGKVLKALCSLLGIKKLWTTPLPSTVQWLGGACPPNTTTDDREAESGSSTQVAGAHRLYPNRLQCNMVLGDWVLALLPNVWKAAPAAH